MVRVKYNHWNIKYGCISIQHIIKCSGTSSRTYDYTQENVSSKWNHTALQFIFCSFSWDTVNDGQLRLRQQTTRQHFLCHVPVSRLKMPVVGQRTTPVRIILLLRVAQTSIHLNPDVTPSHPAQINLCLLWEYVCVCEGETRHSRETEGPSLAI